MSTTKSELADELAGELASNLNKKFKDAFNKLEKLSKNIILK